jgi:glycosyltransferase involved in cell wall biosynthesis
MTIGFYLANIKPSDGGIYQYSVYVLKMLVKCDSIKKIYLFYRAKEQSNFHEFINNKKIVAVNHPHYGRIAEASRHLADFWLTRYYMRVKKQKYCLRIYKMLNPDRRFLNKYKIDILHVPRQHAPAYELNYPVAVTMHDVQHFHFPEFFTPLERTHKAIRYHISMEEADHIIVSFNHVKSDLLKYFRSIHSKISVCRVPLTDDWINTTACPFHELKEKYDLPDVFMLTPAATWEHKNHLAILDALNLLRGESFKVFWVATGYKTPFYKTIEARIKQLELEDQVLFTDVIPERELKGLYDMASLVVIPTLYEAGSGPLFEAMRYEVPVICSNVTSLPETIGNSEFLFNPLNVLEIASLIKLSLTDEDFIRRNKENSKIQSAYLRNLQYQESFVQAYKDAIEGFTQNRQKKAYGTQKKVKK